MLSSDVICLSYKDSTALLLIFSRYRESIVCCERRKAEIRNEIKTKNLGLTILNLPSILTIIDEFV